MTPPKGWRQDGVVPDVENGCIVIYVSDELAAYDLARAFGRTDGFYRDVMAAAGKVWPNTPAATDDEGGD